MTEITQSISSLGSVPTTADPTTFDSRADTFLGTSLPTLRTEINTWAGQANTVAGEVNTNATTASTAASNASASEVAALANAAVALAAANYVGAWSTLTGAKSVGISTDHEGAFWILVTATADVTADEPGVSAKWARAYGGGVIYERTTAIEFTAEDSGKIFKITSGTFSQAFDACANLKEGWFCYLYDTGTGVITLDPDGAELIDGAATKVLPKDALTLVICTGTAFDTITTLMPLADNHVTVTTGNGYGSTNTRIRRFTTTLSSAGQALTYADSAANGGSVTVNEAGLYEIMVSDGGAGSNQTYGFGVSINSNQLTTNLDSITATHRAIYVNHYNETAANNTSSTGCRTMRLAAGDVIRAHYGLPSAPDSSAVAVTMLSVRKVGAL